MAVSIVGIENLALQAYFLIACSYVNLLYTFKVRPFKKKLLNLQEIFNESTILISIILIFVSEILELGQRQAVSRTILFVYLFNIVANMAVGLGLTAKKTYFKFKKKFLRS